MRMSSLVVRSASVLGCSLFLLFSIPVPASAGGVYFVKKGDTLASLALVFKVDADSILERNQLATADIKPGDRLRIPDLPSNTDSLAAVLTQSTEPSDLAESAAAAAAVELAELSAAAPELVEPEPAAEVAPRHEVDSDRVLKAVRRDETVYHSVNRGDTLSSIAGRYGTDLDNLLQLNGLRKTSHHSIGQKILVRKSGPHTHTVARGETLTRIASRYGVDAGEIVRLNHLEGKKLVAGQRLQIELSDPYATAGSAPPSLDGPDVPTQPALDDAGRGISASTAAIAKRLINLARTMINVPYRFGGSSLRGIDCSAYVQRVFGLMDLQIPRTAREQYAVGARVGKNDIQIGDLIFFRTYASYPSHVGIYLGENLFIHASSMVHRVSIDSIDLPYYRKRFIGARRLIVDNASAVASTTP